MTRARDSLNLLVPQRFYVTQQRAWGDRHLYATLSRFIPPGVLSRFERIDPNPAAAMTPAETGPPLMDAGAALRGRWA
jgi:DNA helicase-2/ATP-dependent DNA helicase PcrA